MSVYAYVDYSINHTDIRHTYTVQSVSSTRHVTQEYSGYLQCSTLYYTHVHTIHTHTHV